MTVGEELALLTNTTQALIDAVNVKKATLDNIKVTTSLGKVFDGNETARLNMVSAINSAQFLGLVEANWKLADNTVKLVTLQELQEALALSIQEVGKVVTA